MEGAFDGFWEQYPRKRAKLDALKAWRKIPLTIELLEKMALALEAQMRTKQWRDGFIPYPATWLRRRQWEDELSGADFHKARL